jgi:hypothetical protein
MILRRSVETSPPAMLPQLASEAMTLADRICWSALEAGDANRFRRHAQTAVALHEFSASAGLLP